MRTEFTGIKYRSADGRADYVFDFEYVSPDVGWRAYIVSQTPYRGRDESMHATHRLGPEGSRYVCWTDPLRTIAEAKHIAALWADCTQEYIRTGQFREPIGRPTVGDRTSMAGTQTAQATAITSSTSTSSQATSDGFMERIARLIRS